MKTNPRLKMLVGYAGRDFSLAPGDETEQFSTQEARRLIEAEHAIKVDPPQPKKPATKQEWDDERAQLLEENGRLKSELEAATQAVATLTDQNATLLGAGLVFGEAIGLVRPEQAVTEPAKEKRG